MPAFARYLGIDYSGAATPESKLPGLRVYCADAQAPPRELRPPHGHWSRRALALYLEQLLSEPVPTLAGIDHGFSFPLDYFQRYQLSSWDHFLADFARHWPTAAPAATVQQFRTSNPRSGDARSRRLAEFQCQAKSVFHFDVQGSVAKSTHAGLPWLLHLRRALGPRLHVWPFDGWHIPPGRSVLAEVYPRVCLTECPNSEPTPDQRDACAVAAWLQKLDQQGTLETRLQPALEPNQYATACLEGWILGVAPPSAR